MKTETMEIIFMVSIIFCSVLIGGLSTIIMYPQVMSMSFVSGIGDHHTNDCKNLSLEDTASCLNEEVLLFFDYNISNKGKKLTLDELKDQGGVCSHYSDYYSSRAREIGGFHVEEKIIPTGSDASHIYTIISNEHGYCDLDQRIIHCVRLGDDDE